MAKKKKISKKIFFIPIKLEKCKSKQLFLFTLVGIVKVNNNNKPTTNAGVGMEKRESLFTVGE